MFTHSFSTPAQRHDRYNHYYYDVSLSAHPPESTTEPPQAQPYETPPLSRQARMRQRVSELARRIVIAPIRRTTAFSISSRPMPQAVAAVLKDATLKTLDLAVDEGMLTFVLLAAQSLSHFASTQ